MEASSVYCLNLWTSRKPRQFYNANRNPICRALSLCTQLSPPRIFPPVKGLVRVRSRRFCLLTFALSFVCCFSQVDLLCVSLSRLFQRLPLIFLSGSEEHNSLSPFLQSRYLPVLSACVSPFAAKSAAILLFSWEGKRELSRRRGGGF